jgi:para-nitrobenzyl esterase
MGAPIVETSHGKLEGCEDGGFRVFRGIRFARPPIGSLRFRPPAPPERWAGVRAAVDFAPAAPQPPDLIGPAIGLERPRERGEDCLALNVWTPGCDGGRRPVLVWIHGGAFTIGAGSQPVFDGAALARRGDVVVVTVNYRLGVLGFLPLAAVTDGAISTTGNEGLLDQVAALTWVRDEIAAFGGDPANVTVFGESAGSISVSALLAMPAARGLFRRAILQSGAPNLVAGPATGERVAHAVLEAIDARPADAATKLRALPVDRLIAAQIRTLVSLGLEMGGLVYRPSVDGTVIPQHPFEALAAGSAAGVDVLVGTTLDEMKLFALIDQQAANLDEAGLSRRCERTIPGTDAQGTPHARRTVERYRELRAARGAATAPPDLWFAIESDRVFRYAAMRLAALQRQHHENVYAYLFTWPSPYQGDRLGACHALDIPFVFGTHTMPVLHAFTGTGPAADAFAERIQDAWIAFARTGRPSHPGLGEWPAYDAARRRTMLLGHECGVVDAPYEGERRFWESVA